MAPPEILEYRVRPHDAGVRVDRILRRLLPDVPLSHIHAMLRRGEVTLSGEGASGSDRIKPGDVVRIALDPEQAADLRVRLSGGGRRAAGAGRAIPLPVLYEDEHLVALDKPSGVACHPGSSHPLEKTALGALLAFTGEGGATFRPSLVGRLDRDTSGVQLAGRSPEGLRGLEALSRSRGISKTYLALARGETLVSPGRLDSPLRDRGSGRAVRTKPLTRSDRAVRAKPLTGPDRARMQAVPEAGTDEAVTAVTEYRVVARGGGASLVEVEPLTGRRHQIRAHFAHLGAHLAGDARYGDRAWNSLLRRRAGLRRLFLHCTKVVFKHPVTGARTSVSSPLPRELAAVLTKLGTRAPGRRNS